MLYIKKKKNKNVKDYLLIYEQLKFALDEIKQK